MFNIVRLIALSWIRKLPTFHRTQRWWCRYYSKDKYHSEDRWPLGRWRRRWCYPQRLARTKLKYLRFTSYASHLFMGEWVEKEFNIHIIATATGPSYWILHSTSTYLWQECIQKLQRWWRWSQTQRAPRWVCWRNYSFPWTREQWLSEGFPSTRTLPPEAVMKIFWLTLLLTF